MDTPLTLFETKAGELSAVAREAAAVAADAAAAGTGAPIRAEQPIRHLTTNHMQDALKHMLTRLMPR